MRFKARVVQPQLQALHDVVTTLAKVGTQLRLLLSTKAVKLFAVTDDDYLVAYSVLDAGRVFAGARVESKSDNEIYLETTFPLVASALSSATSASFVTLKLIQRVGQAFLSFEVQNSGSGVTIVQDVPVGVLPPSDAALFTEPRIPPPEVSLLVRDTRSLRFVAERMRGLSSSVTLDADMGGALSVSIQTETVAVKTFYRGLVPQGASDPASRSVVRVHSKRLAKVLSSCHTLPGQLIACISGGTALVFHVVLDKHVGSVTYVMSVLVEEEEAGFQMGKRQREPEE